MKLSILPLIDGMTRGSRGIVGSSSLRFRVVSITKELTRWNIGADVARGHENVSAHLVLCMLIPTALQLLQHVNRLSEIAELSFHTVHLGTHDGFDVLSRLFRCFSCFLELQLIVTHLGDISEDKYETSDLFSRLTVC